MTQPHWIPLDFVLQVHSAQILEHGGGDGIHDQGLLERAMARPLNAFSYGEKDLCKLAALYGAGIIQNHPFIDGNKRTGLVILELFLEANGLRSEASDEETLAAILSVASGEWDDEDLANWLRKHAAKLS